MSNNEPAQTAFNCISLIGKKKERKRKDKEAISREEMLKSLYIILNCLNNVS